MENMTAKVSCFARAYHFNNNAVHVFADEAAAPLLGAEYDQIAESMTQGISFFFPGFKGSGAEGLRMIVDKQLSPSVLGRSAFCEKMLENEMRLGCVQYVVFASGYDTFALRNKETSLSVYELDLPEVLKDKEKRIESAGLTSCAVYVPCDLSEAGWTKNLREKGFGPDRKSFGSLLGISYYLNRAEWGGLIRSIASVMTKGSAICFDYPSVHESKETNVNKELAEGAGEKMKALYSYGEMEALLAESGFLTYEHLRHDDMTRQYFSAYNDSVPENTITAPEGVEYILAVKQHS